MSDDTLRAAQMAVFERWFGPPSDGISAATRRAIADELVALAASATDEPTICRCGLAKSYHGPPTNLANHEYVAASATDEPT